MVDEKVPKISEVLESVTQVYKLPLSSAFKLDMVAAVVNPFSFVQVSFDSTVKFNMAFRTSPHVLVYVFTL